MPLIKKFVDTYGGTIEVLSQTNAGGEGGSGTTVRLHLRSGENE